MQENIDNSVLVECNNRLLDKNALLEEKAFAYKHLYESKKDETSWTHTMYFCLALGCALPDWSSRTFLISGLIFWGAYFLYCAVIKWLVQNGRL